MTDEQRKYREALLGKKRIYKKSKKKFELPPYTHWTEWQTKIWYLENCLHWVNYLTNDGANPVRNFIRMEEIIKALETHCKDMRTLLNKDIQAQVSDTTMMPQG